MKSTGRGTGDVKIPLEQELLSHARDYYFYGSYKVAVIEAEQHLKPSYMHS